jgi:hypothetical protein
MIRDMTNLSILSIIVITGSALIGICSVALAIIEVSEMFNKFKK